MALRVLAHFVPGTKVLDFLAPEADWLDIRWCADDDSRDSQATFYRELPDADVIWHVLRPLSGAEPESGRGPAPRRHHLPLPEQGPGPPLPHDLGAAGGLEVRLRHGPCGTAASRRGCTGGASPNHLEGNIALVFAIGPPCGKDFSHPPLAEPPANFPGPDASAGRKCFAWGRKRRSHSSNDRLGGVAGGVLRREKRRNFL